MSNLVWLNDEIQAHLANGDPQCPECGSFKVESKKDIGFQRGKPHREEYSKTIYYYECECGHQFEG